MNKIDEAWAILKQLPPREQEIAAEAILDYAAAAAGPQLTSEQAEEVARRLRNPEAASITPAELRARSVLACLK